MIAFLDALKLKKTAPSNRKKIADQADENLQAKDQMAKSIELLEAAGQTQAAMAHRRHYQSGLEQMAHVQIELGEEGIVLSTPTGYRWQLEDAHAKDFINLPVGFAQAYLQRRLRSFLQEAFCPSGAARAEQTLETVSLSQDHLEDFPALPANDRIGGGLHVGILQQFAQSNRGKGYFHPGWQILKEEEDDGTVALQNYGITLHIERDRYLRPIEKEARIGDIVSIWMPGHRFESEAYIAIGDCGPVAEDRLALDIYLAVPVTGMSPVMTQLTTHLNETLHIPFTLKAPYEPEGYQGPAAMALRIEIKDYAAVLPVLQQVAQHCQPLPLPMFACPLLPGISFACGMVNTKEQWYGSRADLSQLDAIATALLKAWYTNLRSDQSPTPAENLAAIQAEFSQVGIDWESPYWTAEASGGAVRA